MELIGLSFTIRHGHLFFRLSVLWLVLKVETTLFRINHHSIDLYLIRRYGFSWALLGVTYSKHSGYKWVDYLGKKKSSPLKRVS